MTICILGRDIHSHILTEADLSKGGKMIYLIDFQTVSLYVTQTGLQFKTILAHFTHARITSMAKHSQPKTTYLLKKVKINKTHIYICIDRKRKPVFFMLIFILLMPSLNRFMQVSQIRPQLTECLQCNRTNFEMNIQTPLVFPIIVYVAR